MSLIDGTRIAAIIREAEGDEILRKRLYYCPEKVIETHGDLTDAEAHALRMGDLSAIDLDKETLTLGRRLFTESPDSGVSGDPFLDLNSRTIPSVDATDGIC